MIAGKAPCGVRRAAAMKSGREIGPVAARRLTRRPPIYVSPAIDASPELR